MKRTLPRLRSLATGLCLGLIATGTYAASITLTNSDPNPTYLNSSFTAKGYWNDSVGPTNINDYFTTSAYLIRTPVDTTNYTFKGNSLTLNGPGSTTAGGGRLLTKNNAAVTYTIPNLVITNLGMIQNGANNNTAVTIAGSITVTNGGWVLLPGNNQITIAADVAGDGPLWLGSPSAGSGNSVVFRGAVSNYTGSVYSTNNTSTLVFSNTLVQTYAGNLIMSRSNGLAIQGSGVLTLTGANTYGGVTTISGGTLILAGNNIGATNSTFITNSATTLQLQANAGNTVNGTNFALGTLAPAASRLNNGGILQLRSDSSVLFNGGDSLAGVGNATVTFDVNQLTGSGANQVLSFASAGFNTYNTVINVTGGNGYSLALGPLNGINSPGTLTLAPSTAGLSVAGISGTMNPLTKNGAGTLTLTAPGTYTGSTVINTGILALASSASLASTNILVNAGGTLDVTRLAGSSLALAAGQVLRGHGTVQGSVDGGSGLLFPGGDLVAGTLTITTNLTLPGGGSLDFDLSGNLTPGSGSNDLLVVGGNVAIAGPTALNLKFLNGSPATGVYTLVQCGSISTDLSQVTLPVNPRYTFALNTNVTGTAIQLSVTGNPASLVWRGDEFSNVWDNSGGYQSWINSGSPDYFFDGDVVVFDDSGSNSLPVSLSGTLLPSSVTVNSTNDYDFAGGGQIVSPGTLTKNNSGTLILETANSYAATVINGGTLQVGNGGGVGSLSGPISNHGALVVNENGAVVLSSPVSGSGSLAQSGTGSLTLSVSNSYNGATWVNSGTLYLGNSDGLGSVGGGTTVAGGGQLFISGSINVGAEPLVLNGTGPDGSGALRKNGGNAATFGGPITLGSDAAIKVDGGGTLNLTNAAGIDGSAVNASLTLAGDGSSIGRVSGSLSLGTGALTINSAGTWALNATNHYSGGTTLTAGVVNVNTNGALGTGLVTATTSGRFVIADGLNVTNAFTATVVNAGSGLAFFMVNDNTNGTVTTLSGPLAFNATPSSGGNFIGPVSSGYLNVSGPVTMPDATYLVVRGGNVRFSGAGSSYPEIRVGAGTTSLGVNDGVAINTVMDIGGAGAAVFDLNGLHQLLAGLKNTAGPNNAAWVTNSSATAGTLTLDLGAGNYSFGGSLVGNLALVLNSGTQTLAKTGTTPLNGLDIYTGDTTINGGTLAIGSGVVLTNTPNITIASGATLDVSAAGLTLSPVQTLKGNGTVNGNVTGGGVAPGTSIGALTVNGNSTLSGLTTFEVNASAGTNDQWIVSGTATYGGTLFATNLAGSVNIGDSFTIVTAGGHSGRFAAITGSPGPDKAWSFTNGVLSVVAGVNPNPTNLTATVSGGDLILSWPADHLGWKLQTQTNSLAVGLGTNWVEVPGSAAVTSVTNVIDPSNGAVFYRMVLP